MDLSEARWKFREKGDIKGTREPLSLKREKVTQVCISHLQPFKQIKGACLCVTDSVGLPDDHIWQAACFMSLSCMLFSLRVLTSYLPCLPTLLLCVAWGEMENFNLLWKFWINKSKVQQCPFVSFPRDHMEFSRRKCFLKNHSQSL